MTSRKALVELIIEAESVNANEKRISFLSNLIEKDLELLDLIVRYEINIWYMKNHDYECYRRMVDYRLPREVFDKVKKELGDK